MAWKVLSLDLPDLPRILVKHHFDDSGYQIKLTDLSSIWSDSLSKSEIIKQALEVGSSVDPSEDDEQFGILLAKIESALDCKDGTSLSITNDEGDGAALRLDISAPLPQPLPPFQWTLQLRRQAHECIEAEIVTPLILQSSNLEWQIRQLIDALHDKDRVISKICDRLETSGNDLTTVFPGVSNIKTSRKKSQREQLAKHVKGLEDFDEAKFKQRDENATLDGERSTSVLNEVFRGLPASNNEIESLSAWWKRLGQGSQVTPGYQPNDVNGDQIEHDSRRSRGVVDSRSPEDSIMGDGFQKQGTPSHLKTGDNASDIKQDSVTPEDAEDRECESTTDEEDDLDAPSRKTLAGKSRPIAEVNQTSSPSKKLGAIGGRSSQPVAEHAADDEVEVPKQRSRLGAIGGKSRAPEREIEATKGDNVPSMPYSPKRPTMGVIGGKKALSKHSPPPRNEKSPEPAREATATRVSPQVKEKTPRPQEDPEERADKKRDQLKRELEEKAKAPVKKKRKF